MQSKEKVSYKEASDEEDEPVQVKPTKPKAKKTEPSTAPKSDAPKKKKAASDKKEDKETKESKPTVKREKKQYDNPGQTRETPDEVNPLPFHLLSLICNMNLYAVWG